jgi:hypothetical protein
MNNSTLKILQDVIDDIHDAIKTIKGDVNHLLIGHETVKTELHELNGSIQTLIDASKTRLNGF